MTKKDELKELREEIHDHLDRMGKKVSEELDKLQQKLDNIGVELDDVDDDLDCLFDDTGKLWEELEKLRDIIVLMAADQGHFIPERGIVVPELSISRRLLERLAFLPKVGEILDIKK